MANNRLILVHVPTGWAIGIAKRMGREWYCGTGVTPQRLDQFFDCCWAESAINGRDDFKLLIENSDECWTGLEEIQNYTAFKWLSQDADKNQTG